MGRHQVGDLLVGLIPVQNDGSQWPVVKTMVDDPTYLSGWYIVSSQFKKEADNAKWAPTPCELLPRLKGTATQVPRAGGD